MENKEIRGLPPIEKAPTAFLARIKQPYSGIITLLIPLVISWAIWELSFDRRYYGNDQVLFAPLIGGFGLIGIIWSIWFDNWPFYEKIKKPWLLGLLGTCVNLAFTVFFVFVINPVFTSFYQTKFGITAPAVADYIGKSIFGSLSGSFFSFGLLWVAGSMYWPVFKFQQPKRGLFVWMMGTAIAISVWFLLFFFNTNPSAQYQIDAIKPEYLESLAFTQWTIFYSLMTMLIFEYWPWSKLGKKQPWMGILAFIGCALLGWLSSKGFLYIVQHLFHPIFLAWGGVPGELIPVEKSWQTMNISYVDFLICAVVAIAQFFDNWPKKFSQWINFILRFVLVIGLGTLLFFGYYRFSASLFGEPRNYYIKVPTHFIVWFLWIEFIFAYFWRKWPLYKAL